MVHVRIFVRLQPDWQLVAGIALVIFMCSAVKNMEINNRRPMSVTCECTCLFELAASRELKGISITSTAFKDEQRKPTRLSRDPPNIHLTVSLKLQGRNSFSGPWKISGLSDICSKFFK